MLATTITGVACAAALLAAIWVYHHSHTNSPQPPANALPSLLIPCITSHRRFLPVTAIHTFSYPLIYLGLDLDALETGSLDLLRSRGFLYGGKPWSSILGIQQGSYLDIGTPRSGVSFRRRLLDLLERNGVEKSEVGRVWLLTMPSYLGKSGINPLTTYFVYRKNGSEDQGVKEGLLCVVLEVHNTFEERHLYVLRTGVNQDDESTLTGGHHYRWTFPRGFHVSPFNNRAGFYRLEIRDPFFTSSVSTSRANVDPNPKFKVTLNLLTASKEPKLFAVLMNHPTQQAGPITLRNILTKVLWKQPVSLLMTTPRILAQAWVLHYRKGLMVYPRPEPECVVVAAAGSLSANGDEREGSVTPYSSEDSDTIVVPLPPSALESSVREKRKKDDLEPTWNPVESDLAKVGRTIGWQAISGTERYAERRLVVPWLQGRCEELGVNVRIRFTNQDRRQVGVGASRKTAPTLQITTRHPNFFTQLVCSETPRHFLLAANADFHTYVSSAELFERVFAPFGQGDGAARGQRKGKASWDQEWALRLRRKHLFFLLSFATKPPPLEILLPPPPHFLHHSPPRSAHHLSFFQRAMIVYIVSLAYGMDRLEEWIMYAVGARFVEGQEPWGVWRRVVDSCWRRGDVDDPTGDLDVVKGRGEVAAQLEMDRRWGSVIASG